MKMPGASSNCESYNIQRYLEITPSNPTFIYEGEDEKGDGWGWIVDKRVAPGPMASQWQSWT